MELSKSTEFYKKNWKIKITDDNGYISKYSHTPIEMIKFAEKYYQHRLSVTNVGDNNSVINGIISESDNISKCDNCNGIIDSFTGLCNEGCKRTVSCPNCGSDSAKINENTYQCYAMNCSQVWTR